MKSLLKYADCNNPRSPAFRIRKRRTRLVQNLIKQLGDSDIRILDVGGTLDFWNNMGFTGDEKCRVIIVNLQNYDTSGYPFITSIKGDGRNIDMFSDREFDLVISNSVIEHVGNSDDQKRFAKEIMRLGKNYLVQTPYYYFPMEPHFLFPCFQFLPEKLQIFLLMHFNLGYYQKTKDRREIANILHSVKLLKRREVATLFPEAIIIEEQMFGITQSLLAIGGERTKRDVTGYLFSAPASLYQPGAG